MYPWEQQLSKSASTLALLRTEHEVQWAARALSTGTWRHWMSYRLNYTARGRRHRGTSPSCVGGAWPWIFSGGMWELESITLEQPSFIGVFCGGSYGPVVGSFTTQLR